MEFITEHDVVRLANAMSVKCDLNIKVDLASQCTSDFILTIYNAVMGELPVGVLADCTSLDAQYHNISCVVDTLADDYLHVDLSHISPQYVVAGDPTSIYNLLEILDGLFEFMLDQISNDLDSGDEGDVDSEVFSEKQLSHTWGGRERKYDSDTFLDSSTNTADLIALDDKAQKDRVEQLTDVDDQHFVPMQKSLSPDVDWQELKSAGSISEHTLELTDFNDTLRGDASADRTESLLRLAETEVKQIDLSSNNDPVSLRSTHETKPLKETYKVDLEPHTTKQETDLKSTYKVPVSEPSIIIDDSDKGSAMSVSDVTSNDVQSSTPSSVVMEGRPQPNLTQKSQSSSASSSGVDEPDGIPKPDLMTEQIYQPPSIDNSFEDTDRGQVNRRHPGSTEAPQQQRDWVKLLNNLQKTVDDSRKIREKYFATPQADSMLSDSRDTGIEERSRPSVVHSDSEVLRDSTRPKSLQRNVRFEDTISTKTAKELKEFRQVLQREKQLQDLKNKVLSASYHDHLDEVQEAEREKIRPLARKARKTERDFNAKMKQRQRKAPQKSGAKKDLATAAKWKSWQTPIVKKTPRSHPIPSERKIKGDLEIGEHDLLPLLISEFPGLELSSHTVNNAWKKQFRQIEVLTSRESQHQKARKHTEKQMQEAHHRHHLLTDIMRREHEHTQRVRESKERQAGRREAQRSVKDRRQQSARVRRYYRDYQLQMRARMLKRRTKEEKLFRNLFEEGLDIQRSRLRELRKYARDKREIQQTRQRNEIASLENYYKDQFAILAETLDSEKNQLRVRDKAQTELLRKMKSGLRQKMEREISNLQERITRDDEDVYFREMEADRIRRQLQLATYHAKFDSSLAKSM
uniref:Centrosomal protein of 95 kDa-like n=1 Tax=Phallusia mammillata TaxID=59560 RepID=A0A6F9D9V1_9ASCI|nr:centrosomal protein of 95 kDa-like [Phallusia mammillata]